MTETGSCSLQEGVGHVLIVDDEAFNRELLNAILKSKGHETSEAESGNQALELVRSRPVDVVLLDVMMPSPDGFEVCRRLKEDPQTAHIPVLLVTSLSDRRDRLMGIEVGASDFLIKPVDIQEVLLRVRNAIYAKRLYDRLQESFQKLKDLETLRDKLTHMLVHDMRSPLAGIHGYLEMIKLHSQMQQNRKILRYADQALQSTSSLIEMVSSILDVSRLEEGKMPLDLVRVDLAELARQVIDSLASAKKESRVSLVCRDKTVEAVCDPYIIRRVITNLVANALKFSEENTPVVVGIERGEHEVKLWISDRGPGIHRDHLPIIFEKYGQVELRNQRQKYSTGLGLTFCKLALEAHHGRIGVDTEVGKGSTFWITLPA